MARVSVIVPAHNAAAFIDGTLRSVVAQTVGDWEAVVVDDASSDATAETAAAIDPRIRVVSSDVNLGPAGARNLALEHASGELCVLLDADDAWEPTYLERQLELYDRLSADRRIGAVSSDAWLVDEDGNVLGRYYDRLDPPGPPEIVTLERLLEWNVIYVGTLVPRAVIDEVGPFDTATWGSEDHDLWLRIAEAGYELVVNPEPLARYRLAAGSVSSSLVSLARTNQVTYRLALDRGRLTSAQQRIARRALDYSRAMERVGAVATAPRGQRLAAVASAVRQAPLLTRVVLQNRRRWGAWWRVLRARGRDPRLA
jgi:teichuronic acid biosynthesis glycosyltransferase TuaG